MTDQERKSPAATGLIQNDFNTNFTGRDTPQKAEPVEQQTDWEAFYDYADKRNPSQPRVTPNLGPIGLLKSSSECPKPAAAEVQPLEEQPAALFDLEAARVTPEWFTAEPPPREWLVRELLPDGVVGILAAPGGTGKSLLLQQLAVAVAGGLPFLGCEIDRPGAVVYLSMEDDRDELRRRLHAIGQSAGGLPFELVAGRLYMLDLVASGFKLTHSANGGRDITVNALLIARLREALRQIDGLRLIVLDTYSRANGGDENSNVHSATFVQACEQLRQDTSCTVIVSAHTTKASRGAVKATDVAGGARLVDSARWMAGLDRYMTNDKGECSPENARHIRLTVGKSNYGQTGAQFYLEFRDGVLTHRSEAAKPAKPESKDDQSDARYRDVLARACSLIQRKNAEGTPLTRRKLRDFAGREGSLGVGQTVLDQVICRALEEGDLFLQTVGRDQHLALWPQREG